VREINFIQEKQIEKIVHLIIKEDYQVQANLKSIMKGNQIYSFKL